MEDSNRNFKLQTCEDFIEVLASKAAVPGGGGAAALTGAIGIALGNMQMQKMKLSNARKRRMRSQKNSQN